GGLALYAITREREIGVDLERIKTDFIEEGIISQCLTPQEIAHFQMLSETERVSFFFDCWTLKEVYLKASGDGFLIPPNQIETSLLIEFPSNLVDSFEEIQQPLFSLQKLPRIPGYKAALAVEGNNPQLKFWLYNN
ncbi:MAG TPA: 4'-phosphopantetheinyl transferase superfamily protein, partial [Pyrinomonadaceae bacterium]|nr:4'-phosphopantetheinyl transferase superfamily protein [Pyrinomonadaceae bacterium]